MSLSFTLTTWHGSCEQTVTKGQCERRGATREERGEWLDMKGVAYHDRGSKTREARCTKLGGEAAVFLFLRSNQPCSDAFLAEWGVISTMMMTRMRTTTMTANDVNNDNHNENENDMNVNDNLVF